MRRAVCAEKVAERRCAVEHPPTLGLLAVEHPQGVALDPLPALFAEAVGIRAEIADELRPITRSTLGLLVAERVDLDLESLREVEPPEELDEHRDHFGIERRVLVAERFHVELMELAIPARLGPLVPEHGPHGVQLDGLRVHEQTVLDVRAQEPGRRLGPQRHGIAAPILERVHLLLNDVGRLADAPGEEFSALKDRQANLLIAV